MWGPINIVPFAFADWKKNNNKKLEIVCAFCIAWNSGKKINLHMYFDFKENWYMNKCVLLLLWLRMHHFCFSVSNWEQYAGNVVVILIDWLRNW